MFRCAVAPLRLRFAARGFLSATAAAVAATSYTPPPLSQLLDAHLNYRKTVEDELQFNRTAAAIEEFRPTGEALNALLAESVAADKGYLNDLPVNDRANLASREPLYIKSNWWFELNDHPKHPAELIGKPPPSGVISSFQVSRAAGLISRLLRYKAAIRDTDLKRENLFGSARIPGEAIDSYFVSKGSKHIVLMTKDQMFKIHVYNDDGSIPETKEIERLLYAACAQSLQTKKAPCVGLLTSLPRAEWAKHYGNLSLTPSNKENLDTIASALFTVHLDDHSTIANHNYSHQQFMHNGNGRNRWFDKTLQVILASSGRAGFNCQVSGVPVGLFREVAQNLIASERGARNDPDYSVPMLPDPVKLGWTLDDKIHKAITLAEQKAAAEAKFVESVLLSCSVLGKRYIDEIAKTDVDAFMQIALHLTFWRLHKFVPTASILLTRPETGETLTRSLADKYVAEFVKNFDDDDVLYDDKRAQFRNAVQSIKNVMAETQTDSVPSTIAHLQALYQLADQEQKRQIENAFKSENTIDAAPFLRKYTLDTVRVGAGNKGSGSFYTGFSQSYGPGGYGVAYSVGLDDVKVTVSCQKAGKGKQNSYRFVDGLTSVFADLMFLFPKRSEIWGYDWKEKFARQAKEEYFFKRMKGLSNQYVARKSELARKYGLAKSIQKN